MLLGCLFTFEVHAVPVLHLVDGGLSPPTFSAGTAQVQHCNRRDKKKSKLIFFPTAVRINHVRPSSFLLVLVTTSAWKFLWTSTSLRSGGSSCPGLSLRKSCLKRRVLWTAEISLRSAAETIRPCSCSVAALAWPKKRRKFILCVLHSCSLALIGGVFSKTHIVCVFALRLSRFYLVPGQFSFFFVFLRLLLSVIGGGRC